MSEFAVHSPNRRVAFVVFVLCALPRTAALFWFSPTASMEHYWVMSDALLERGIYGVETTYLEPLYPAFLAALRWLTGDRLALVVSGQIGIAALAGVLLYGLTERLTGSRTAAWIAALLYAFDPYLVRQAVSIAEVTLCTALLVAAASHFDRSHATRHGAAAGICLGLTALTRFSLLPVAAGAIGLLAWKRRWRDAAVVAGTTVATLAPWMAWLSTTGAVVPTRVGVNLFVATSEYSDQIVPTRNVDLLVPYAYEIVAREPIDTRLSGTALERHVDAIFLKRVVEFARSHPRETIGLKLTNLAYTFAPMLLPIEHQPPNAFATIEDGIVHVTGLVPRPLIDHVAYSTARLGLLIGAGAGLLLRRRWTRGDALLLVTAASVIGVQTVFFPTSRLLAPMAFVLMVYTACALAEGFDRTAGRSGPSSVLGGKGLPGGRSPATPARP